MSDKKVLFEGLNENQHELATTIEGVFAVDAGPGTGKTSTITERYANMVLSGIDPSRILMVTFTRNSAADMRRKIAERLADLESQIDGDDAESERRRKILSEAQKKIRVSTFDSCCLRIVQGSPEVVSEFFGFRESLSRNASLIENETMNKEYFASFYAEFSEKYGHLYRKNGIDIPALVADRVSDLYDLLVRLMSFGIIPLADDEWFGDGERRLLGDRTRMMDVLDSLKNGKGPEKLTGDAYASDVPDMLLVGKSERGDDYQIPDSVLESVAGEDRRALLYFIRHVFYEYIRRSVRDNRLTFSLVKIFSFAVLHSSEYARDLNSVDYMMVDEFQDTDDIQLKICLMMLTADNLCVVGDWKQGIYGFRNASIENLKHFADRTDAYVDQLRGLVRMCFDKDKCKTLRMKHNYRSTRAILDPGFSSMRAPGTKGESVEIEEGSVTELVTVKDSDEGKHSDLHRQYTSTEFWSSEEDEKEYSDLVDKVTEYVYSGRYSIVEDDGSIRPPNFGDIGVLFRNIKGCNAFFEEASKRHIPVFMQGDVEIMSSVPGKLALAWLRLVNDRNDRRGATALLAHRGLSMSSIKAIFDEADKKGCGIFELLPSDIINEVDYLSGKRKRPNELLTAIFAFHAIGDNDENEADIAQAIINVVASSYDGSLITIPDIIRLIEDDIVNSSRYPIDTILGRGAVTVQTMHKSKGLEYPIVIVGGLDQNVMPSTRGNDCMFTFDDVWGLRCKKESVVTNGVPGIVGSWRYELIKDCVEKDYDEERRLLFVSMTRAKQYMLVASGPNPSEFFNYVAGQSDLTQPKKEEVPKQDRSDFVTEPPEIPTYTRRRLNLAVHDIMEYKEGDGGGKGKEYGKRVHQIAEQMAHGKKHDDIPEAAEIAKVLEKVKGALDIETEFECALPAEQATIRGTIDLVADFGDRIEIHDYKTDIDKRNLDSYIVQLSVYGLAAKQSRNVPVRCFVDFVSIPELSVEVELLSMEEIQKKVDSYLSESVKVG